jgi:hypothetical protein
MTSIYLLHGDNEARINEAKLRLIGKHLSPELRAHNLTEFSPVGQRWITSLEPILAELISELSLPSLLPEANRVVVVYNLADLYQKKARKGPESAKGTKTKETAALKYLLDFLAGPFQHSPNVLILVATEEQGKYRTLNKKSPLYVLVKKTGIIQEISDRPLRYRLTDALLAQDTPQCIKAFRQWFASYDKARQDIFKSVLSDIHLLLQAKILNAKETSFGANKQLRHILFPKELQANIVQQHPYRKKKFQDAALQYSTTQLTCALKYLLRLNRALYPLQYDRYVPDVQVMFEVFLVGLTTQTLNPDQKWEA